MRTDEDRDTVGGEDLELVPEIAAGLRIDAGRGLIKQ